MIELKKETCEEKISSINFFSSNMPNLHTLYKDNTSPDRHVDQLEILSSLKEKGNLTENEFEVFKEQLIKNINKNE